MYYSFVPGRVGYHLVGGTSEATPEFAGIVAMAAQLADRRLGKLGERLYALHKRGIIDIPQGNNTFGPFTNSDGIAHNVTFASTDVASVPNWTSGARTVSMPATTGTYSYTCTIHAGMNGTVKVQ